MITIYITILPEGYTCSNTIAIQCRECDYSLLLIALDKAPNVTFIKKES